MKKVLITATSGEDTYPTICGEHEFTSLDEAIEFVYYGTYGITGKFYELVIWLNVPDYWDTDADVIIEIYDDYRE